MPRNGHDPNRQFEIPPDPFALIPGKLKAAPIAAPLQLVFADDIRPAVESNDFVEGLLGRKQLSVIYGESGCGKTFLATDLALHVALGRKWRGREVEQGAVVYVAAEGTFGVRNRIAAFRQHFEIIQDIPLAIVPQSIDLRDPAADTGRLCDTIRHVQTRLKLPVHSVFVDTLSRVIAGGNENSPEDMGAVVRNGDTVREDVGVHVCFIHHSGKDGAKGARGHSLLRAATDTEIEVTRTDGVSVARVTKQRELPTEGEFAFRLEPVELGVNQRGKPVTSCVVVPVDEAIGTRARLTTRERRALDVLRNSLADQGQPAPRTGQFPAVSVVSLDTWRDYLRRAGVTNRDNPSSERSQWSSIQQALDSKGVIRSWDGLVWLAETNETRRDNA